MKPSSVIPVTAPNTIAKTAKSILAVAVFREFPTLKRQRFWGSGLKVLGRRPLVGRLLLRLGGKRLDSWIV